MNFLKSSKLPRSEITPKTDFFNRREILKSAGFTLAGGLLFAAFPVGGGAFAIPKGPLGNVRKTDYTVPEAPLTDKKHVTGYNNFYEFTTDKEDVAELSQSFQTDPWSITVEGDTERPGAYDLGDLINWNSLEERIYRFRCVEAWSMVVPWIGVPLADIIKKLRPTSKAKYVQFFTLHDPEQMPKQKTGLLDWPYREGLRMDEALHPLTLLSVGLYGEILPNQNGAPVRLIVPWKYGFKSIKSITRIRFTETQPANTWNIMAPNEYGFYANVNPEVDHPRWSQATERRLGGGFFAGRVETLMFNGYGEQVASLYSGMDLRRHF